VTQLRNNPTSLSNYFDRLLNGIGHRGSSFTDVDALTHDERTDRFLFQEFKQSTESIPKGQAKLLNALARKDYITVWCVRIREDGDLDWYDVRLRRKETITTNEYCERFHRWWEREEIIQAPAATSESSPADITADMINWGFGGGQ